MQGYTSSSYGDGFADVYDDWYAELDDPLAWRDLVVGALVDRALPVLELGIGTGRLAIPLAAAGVSVHGVDSSAAMLARIPDGEHRPRLVTHLGDMVDDLPPGPFAAAYCGFNTFFNLLSERRQRAAMDAVARRLVDGGSLIIDTAVFAPAEPDSDGVHTDPSTVELRSMTTDHVVLSVSRTRPAEQRAEGQFIDLGGGTVRLRPWAIRWATVEQLDEMAAAAGLTLSERWANVHRAPFTAGSTRQVSVYRVAHSP